MKKHLPHFAGLALVAAVAFCFSLIIRSGARVGALTAQPTDKLQYALGVVQGAEQLMNDANDRDELKIPKGEMIERRLAQNRMKIAILVIEEELYQRKHGAPSLPAERAEMQKGIALKAQKLPTETLESEMMAGLIQDPDHRRIVEQEMVYRYLKERKLTQ